MRNAHYNSYGSKLAIGLGTCRGKCRLQVLQNKFKR
jgi:hypothetical protein